MDNPHSGHRARKKEQFLLGGGKNLADHELLEMLLYYSVPRRDTNALAHALIERFGSIYAVFEATPQELTAVEGVSPHSATLIKLMLELCRRYFDQRVTISERKNDDIIETIGRKIVARCIGLTREVVFVVCLNNRLNIVSIDEIGEGTPDNVQVACRRIAELAIRNNCGAVVVAHNHPGGLALPSRDDVATTLRLRDTLAGISITLLDHLIAAGEDFVSMAQSGVFAFNRSSNAARAFSADDDGVSPQEAIFEF